MIPPRKNIKEGNQGSYRTRLSVGLFRDRESSHLFIIDNGGQMSHNNHQILKLSLLNQKKAH